MDLWGRLPTRSERSEASKIDNFRPKLVPDWSKFKTGVRIACSRHLVELGAADRGRLRVRPRSPAVVPGLGGADEGLIPLGDLGGALVADLARLGTHRGVRGRLPPAAVLRAPLGRPHRCAARSRSSAIPVYHVVRRATATRAAERPESFAAPRKRSGTLPRTSLSGARSTNTLDMLLLGPSRRPHAPVDWTGRANAPAGLDLRPPRSRRRAAAHCARGGRHHHPDFPRVLAPRPFSHARGVG